MCLVQSQNLNENLCPVPAYLNILFSAISENVKMTIELNFHGVYQLTGFCSERRAKVRRHEKTKEEARKTYFKNACIYDIVHEFFDKIDNDHKYIFVDIKNFIAMSRMDHQE